MNCNLKNIYDVQTKELEALIKRFRSAAKASTFTFFPFRLFTCTMLFTCNMYCHSLFVSCSISLLFYDKIAHPQHTPNPPKKKENEPVAKERDKLS